MWKLKSCPRCKGDVFVDSDEYGWYEQCLQCSYLSYLPSAFEVRKKVAKRNLRQAKRASKTSKVSVNP